LSDAFQSISLISCEHKNELDVWLGDEAKKNRIFHGKLCLFELTKSIYLNCFQHHIFCWFRWFWRLNIFNGICLVCRLSREFSWKTCSRYLRLNFRQENLFSICLFTSDLSLFYSNFRDEKLMEIPSKLFVENLVKNSLKKPQINLPKINQKNPSIKYFPHHKTKLNIGMSCIKYDGNLARIWIPKST
jgi:hypothetical protein